MRSRSHKGHYKPDRRSQISQEHSPSNPGIIYLRERMYPSNPPGKRDNLRREKNLAREHSQRWS